MVWDCRGRHREVEEDGRRGEWSVVRLGEDEEFYVRLRKEERWGEKNKFQKINRKKMKRDRRRVLCMFSYKVSGDIFIQIDFELPP